MEKETRGRKITVSFTLYEDQVQMLEEITLYLSNKKGRTISKSAVYGYLVALGDKYKDEL